MAPSYTILFAESPDLLADQVRLKLAEGWICQGGVAVAVYPVAREGMYSIAGAFNGHSGAINVHVFTRPQFYQAMSLRESAT